MVAKIIVSKSIGRALNYNEKKVQKNKAECIYAGNFLKDKKDLSFTQKLQRFTQLIERNDRAKTNSLHISLNFHASEKWGHGKLTQIATTYINKIGFGDQPFLVYQHHDAGHPHIHIVTTNIRADGTRINTHNIGRNQSETARKEIETEFNLIRATAKGLAKTNSIEAVTPEIVVYGKSETKRSITNVLDGVLPQYKYTSLAELNAVLKQFNVLADRGSDKAVMYQKGGLVYRALDANGNKIGVPIKASSIYSRPTLENITKRFSDNATDRKKYRAEVQQKINEVLSKSTSMQAFIKKLNVQDITAVLRRNDKGFIYGITFVDHQSRTVFNGSDLGKSLSAAGLLEYFNKQLPSSAVDQQETANKAGSATILDREQENTQEHDKERTASESATEILDAMTKAENTRAFIPYDLRKKKKKKRKNKFGL